MKYIALPNIQPWNKRGAVKEYLFLYVISDTEKTNQKVKNSSLQPQAISDKNPAKAVVRRECLLTPFFKNKSAKSRNRMPNEVGQVEPFPTYSCLSIIQDGFMNDMSNNAIHAKCLPTISLTNRNVKRNTVTRTPNPNTRDRYR
jgi:hypothetical protein